MGLVLACPALTSAAAGKQHVCDCSQNMPPTNRLVADDTRVRLDARLSLEGFSHPELDAQDAQEVSPRRPPLPRRAREGPPGRLPFDPFSPGEGPEILFCPLAPCSPAETQA